MGVVTVSREPCSGGSWIAESAAAELGYHLVDMATIEEVLVQYGIVGLKAAYESKPGFWARFDEQTKRTVEMFNRVVFAMAALGEVVIVGRGAFKLLAPYRDVLNARIKAPFERRVQTYLQRYGPKDRGQAEAALAEADRMRAAFLELHYGAKLDSAGGFDLVLDTGKLPPSTAVRLLVGAARALPFPDPADQSSAASIQVDDILLETARKVLAAQT